MTPAQIASLEADGCCILPALVGREKLMSFVTDAESALQNAERETRRGVAHSLRDVFGALPQAREFVRSPAVREIVEPLLGKDCFAVRGLLFDKTPDANWKVPFHQDLTIAVNERTDAPGFSPWSVKAGVLHVQPPREVLESMLTLRLHLDDCDTDNGALRVLPGTHRRGKLTAAEIQESRAAIPETVCEVPAGGVLLMRPLLLHASSPANSPCRRRVLHFDFSSQELSHDLRWYQRICVGAGEE